MSDNQRGAFYMMAAMFTFLVNDGLIKSLASAMTPLQALGLRSLLAAVILWPILRLRGIPIRGFRRRDRGLILVRSLSDTAASGVYISALFMMPLADATAILQVLPLTITLAGALFLGERVGWRRMLAILVGFGGVMLILRPGTQGIERGALLALGAVVLVTTREILTRALSKDVPSLSVAFYTVVSSGTLCLATIPWLPWQPLGLESLGKLLLTTLMVSFGYYFNVMAVRTGELAAVDPFRYSSLVFAIVIGFVVFGEVPEVLTLVGASLVAATGVFTLWREQKVKSAAEVSQQG